MLSKLRGQLDEMKSKVQFLSLVKKYLQASSLLSCHSSEIRTGPQMGFLQSLIHRNQDTLGHAHGPCVKSQSTEKPCHPWVNSKVTHRHIPSGQP
jgi:hypothetical protein